MKCYYCEREEELFPHVIGDGITKMVCHRCREIGLLKDRVKALETPTPITVEVARQIVTKQDKEIEKLKAENTTLKAKVEPEDWRDRLESRLNENYVDKLKAENKKLVAENARLNAVIAKHTTDLGLAVGIQIKDFETGLELAKTIRHWRDKHATQVNRQEVECDKKDAENAALKAKLEAVPATVVDACARIKDHKREIERLKIMLNNTQQESRESDAELRKINEVLDKWDGAVQGEALSFNVESLLAENAVLKAKLDEAGTRIS